MKKRQLLTCTVLALVVSLTVSSFAFAKSKENINVNVDKDKAQEIALSDANISSDSATFTKVKLDDGEYELKFKVGDDKYEYIISAVDGAIVESSADIKEAKADKEDKADKTDKEDKADKTDKEDKVDKEDKEDKTDKEDKSDEDEASSTKPDLTEIEDIVLNESGVSRDNIKYIHSYAVYTDGQPSAYKVEFALKGNKTHYAYFIDINTYEILDSIAH